MRIMKRSWRRGRSIAGIGALGLVSALALVAAPETEAPHALGDEVPNFALLDQRGRLHELRRLGGRAVVLFFTANDCPVARQSAAKLKALREKFGERGVSVLLVNSSPSDTRKYISKEAAELGIWHLPVLK